MNNVDIPQLRLFNTGLRDSPFDSPAAVVSHLGAVQSQDFASAKWAIGLRMQNATDESVEKAFNEGKILRTHVMRPTWHFVSPNDLRWMLELTAPRVKRIIAPRNMKLGITDKVLAKSKTVISEALEGNNHLTRSEIAELLEERGLPARGQRLGHIFVYIELDGVICSGPRRGKQFTYALLEERVPKVKELNRDESLEKLAGKYFSSHGPAQVEDFAWWSGLTVKEAKEGLDRIGPKIVNRTLNGKTYWSIPWNDDNVRSSSMHHPPPKEQAFLLSIYDEYTIAYRDRSDISDDRAIERMISMGNALTSVIITDGLVVGTWKRALKKDTVEIRLSPFRKLNAVEIKAVDAAAERYGTFLNRKVVSTIS